MYSLFLYCGHRKLLSDLMFALYVSIEVGFFLFIQFNLRKLFTSLTVFGSSQVNIVSVLIRCTNILSTITMCLGKTAIF